MLSRTHAFAVRHSATVFDTNHLDLRTGLSTPASDDASMPATERTIRAGQWTTSARTGVIGRCAGDPSAQSQGGSWERVLTAQVNVREMPRRRVRPRLPC